jgi:hypothetical protein
MKIPIATYADVSRRIGTIGSFVFLGAAAVGLLILGFVGLPLATGVKNLAGGNVGSLLAMAVGIPFVLLPVYLPMLALQVIDRKIGIRCPHCNVSLTMRCLPDKILITRKCSQCQSVVLSDEDYSLSPQTSRPWVIIPLSILLMLLIVSAIAMGTIAPSKYVLNDQASWVEFGIELSAFFAIAKIYSIIMRVMKRRWKSEAAGDKSQSPT